MSVIKRSDLVTDEAIAWPDKYKKDLEQIIATSKKLGVTNTPVKKSLTELQKVERQLAVATERSTKEFKDQKAALNTLNTQTRNAVKDVQNLDNAYDRLSKELNDTRKAYKNLTAAGKGNTAQAKAQLAQIRKLDTRLKSIDNTVGQNQRSVGGYSNAIKGATARFLGWAAAIALVGRGLIDAFRRIRQYDKAIVELSGVLRTSRKDLAGLEELILSVAGASTKTSTEVAQLATTLATLGKSKEEIENLLKPVNDLSISLKATSEEAGELLVGTLNAFQESSTEAQRYADVIANMRISTALDFERIKDSLGFVAPTAKAVGLTIEGLGARIGVLVNNSVKASRAGRLLNSSFAKLIKQGLTLEDALDLINESTNKAKTASELFGTESFSLALILADNRDKVAELTEEYKNSQGVLDELTAKQLTSLDAKLNILDSSWEALILTITKGDNKISKFLAGTIDLFSAGLRLMSDTISGADNRLKTFKENLGDFTLEDKAREFKNLSNEAVRLIRIQNRVNLTTEEFLKLSAIERSEVRLARRNKKGLQIELDLILAKMQLLNPAYVENTELIEDNTEANKENEEALKKAAKARQDALKDWIKLNDELERTNTGLSQFGILTKEQETLLKFVEGVFGKGTIDKDAEEFISKVGGAINKVSELSEEQRKIEAEESQLLADTKQAILEKSFELAGELGNRFTDFRLQQIEQELTAQEFARDRELEQAGDNERQKFEINKRFDEERRKLQRKQAINEKANALFQIALNTAVAITRLMGGPQAVLIPFVIGLSAIQAAAVIAAPIPQFDEGKERTPKDYIAGEKRPELRKSKGKWSLVDKPTLFKNSPGDKIVSGKETDSILGNIADLAGNNLLTDKGGILSLLNNELRIEKKKDSDLAYILERNNQDLIKTIKNKKEVSIKVKNAKVTERSGNQIVHIIDYYYKR